MTAMLSLPSLQLLPQFDTVAYMADGRVVEQGPFASLLAQDGATASFASKYQSGSTVDSLRLSDDDFEAKEAPEKKDVADKESDAAPLIAAEYRAQGAVMMATFHSYFQAMGYCWFVGVISGALRRRRRVQPRGGGCRV